MKSDIVSLKVGMSVNLMRRNGDLQAGRYIVIGNFGKYKECLLKLVEIYTDVMPKRKMNFGVVSVDFGKIDEMLRKGDAVITEVPRTEKRVVRIEDMKGKTKEIYEQRLPVLNYMVHPEKLIRLVSEGSEKEFNVMEQKFGISARRLKAWFRRLLDSGLEIRAAAITEHHRCGRKAGVDYTKKQGRRSKLVLSGYKFVNREKNVDEEDRKWIALFLKTGYSSKKTKKQNFDQYMFTFGGGQKLITKGDDVVSNDEMDKRISYDQFRYWVVKNNSGSVEKREQESYLNNVSTVKRRPLGDGRGVDCPGLRLQTDNTLADVHLVTTDRKNIIGRPYIHTFVDAATSTIVGVYVTLKSPSMQVAKLGLLNALSDKYELLKKYELEEYYEYFPQAPIPVELLSDRGEWHSDEGSRVKAELGINELITAPYKADWKAIVERQFRTLNGTSIHWLPGSTMGRQRGPGERDHRLDACLTLYEFTKLILRGVINWNMSGKTAARMNMTALSEGVEHCPAKIYEWGIKNLHGTARYESNEDLLMKLVEPDEITVTDKGINSKNCRWTANWMNEDIAFMNDASRHKGHLYRDPIDACKGHLLLNGEARLREVKVSDHYPVNSEMCHEDLEEYIAVEGVARKLNQSNVQDKQTALKGESYAMVEAAMNKKKLKDSETYRTKKDRTSGVRKHREDELNSMHGMQKETENSNEESLIAASMSTTNLGSMSRTEFMKKIIGVYEQH